MQPVRPRSSAGAVSAACSSTSTPRRPPATCPIDFRVARRRLDERQRAQDGRAAGRRRAAGPAGAAPRRRCSSAGTRSGPGGPGSRTCPPSSAGARRPVRPVRPARRGGARQPDAQTDARAAARPGRWTASRFTATRSGRLPHIVCLGVRGHRTAGGAARARPGRHRRPLGERLRLRGPAAVAGARGHGRRRAPLAADQRRLEHDGRRHRRPRSRELPACSARLRALAG